MKLFRQLVAVVVLHFNRFWALSCKQRNINLCTNNLVHTIIQPTIYRSENHTFRPSSPLSKIPCSPSRCTPTLIPHAPFLSLFLPLLELIYHINFTFPFLHPLLCFFVDIFPFFSFLSYFFPLNATYLSPKGGWDSNI